MSSIRTSSSRRAAADHFEPDVSDDPGAQRRLRGHLEQIDYAAFASNREVIGAMLGHADASRFQKLAVAAAHARADWIGEALAQAETPGRVDPARVTRLSDLRRAYDELAEAYEGLRRLIERGYLTYRATD